MLHILWLLIKCILIFVGILLLVALLVLSACLFVPVRYRGRVKKAAEEIQAQGTITWLFHLLSLRVYYEGKTPGFQIRILGIPLKKRKKKPPKTEDKREPPKKKPRKNREKVSKEIPPPAADTTLVPAKGEGEPVRTQSEQALSEPSFFERLGRALGAVFRWIRQGVRFIWHLPARLLAVPRKIVFTIQKFCGKIKNWKHFLQEEKTRQAISLLWRECRRFLRHLLPRRMGGSVLFGMENPAVTGEILAVLGAAYPVHKNKIRFCPAFDRQVLEGEVWCRGRVFGIVLLVILCRLYFNKNIQYCYRTINHKEV